MLFVLAICCGFGAAPIQATQPGQKQTAYLLKSRDDTQTVALTTLVCSHDPGAVILLETAHPSLKVFLREWRGALHRLNSYDEALAKFVVQAPKVVVCAPEPRPLFLQAACLAGALRAPLLIDDETNRPALRERLQAWGTKEVHAVGTVRSFWNQLGMRTYRLQEEASVQAEYLRHARKRGPVEALVVANPFDESGMSSLAPWIADDKRGVLLLTNRSGDDSTALIREAVKLPELQAVDSLILVGDLKTLPMEKRPNPLAGKDAAIEAEPGTAAGGDPITFATGRLFHDDPAVVALMRARPHLWQQTAEPHQALVVSNPGSGLPLLETYSRSTALELRNAGFKMNALFNKDANRPDVRALLPKQTIFLWEGHHSTLVRDYEVHEWPEPLRPSLIFLQSCLALDCPKAHPFLERGAIAVLGCSSRTYSGSGGALAHSYFDALVYEKQTVGAALRHAKNFLLCFAQLKEKRLGEETKLIGANLRTASAFTLWGDPTVRLPCRPVPDNALPQVSHTLRGNVLTIHVPAQKHGKVVTAKYEAQSLPNARLAGLLTASAEEGEKALVPLLFREVSFANAPPGKVPSLRGRLPRSNWVLLYDARRETGYLLVRPRAKDTEEIRFTVSWD